MIVSLFPQASHHSKLHGESARIVSAATLEFQLFSVKVLQQDERFCLCAAVSINLSPCARSSKAQLLLWPEFRAAYPACRHSSVLQALVFTSHTATTYTHTTHRVFPLKTSAKTSAELTKISSTVSNISKEKQAGTPSLTAPAGSEIHLSVPPQALPNGLDHRSLPCHKGIESLQPLYQDSSTESTDSVRTNDSSGRNNVGVSSNEIKSSGSSKQGRCSLREQDAKSITHEEAPCSEHACVPTNIPKFLLSHMPTVSLTSRHNLV